MPQLLVQNQTMCYNIEPNHGDSESLYPNCVPVCLHFIYFSFISSFVVLLQYIKRSITKLKVFHHWYFRFSKLKEYFPDFLFFVDVLYQKNPISNRNTTVTQKSKFEPNHWGMLTIASFLHTSVFVSIFICLTCTLKKNLCQRQPKCYFSYVVPGKLH